jgi:hypothetical protein
MEQRTMAFGNFMSCVILVHSATAPTDKEWGHYIDFLKQQRTAQTKIIVVTEGGSPGASQRAKLTELFGKVGVPTAVMTESAVARGVVTALSWFYAGKLGAFPTARMDEALIHIGAPVGFAEDIRKIITVLKAEIKSNKPVRTA